MENKSTFAKFIDNSFYCFTLIIFSIIWSGYITNRFLTQVIIGTLFGSFLYLIIFKLIKSTSQKKQLARSEEQYKNACINTLSLASIERTYKFFEIMLNDVYKTKIKKPFLAVLNKVDNTPQFLLHFNFYTEEFSQIDLYNLIDRLALKTTKLLIFSKSFSPECKLVVRDSKYICLLNSHDSYLFFKQFNTFPKISEKIKEKRFNNLKNNIFSSINSKKFIKISLLLIFLSLFTTLKKYYLISASIIFIFAIICRFKRAKTPDDETDFNDFLSLDAKN